MPSDEDGELSRLASGATVDGDLQVEGDLRIEGIVKGEVRCDGHVTVAESGTVEGQVSADRITVSGRVEGRLTAEDVIEIEKGATFDGELTAPLASIQEGAHVEGEVTVGTEAGTPVSSDGTEAVASRA